MITINLIPQTQKDIIKKNKIFQTFKEVIFLLFIFSSTAAIMLLLSFYFLEYQLANLYETNALNIKSNESLNIRISHLNYQINEIENIQKNFQPLQPLINKLSQVINSNIKIDQLIFFRQQTALEINGLAKNRSDLLQLKKNLEAADWIKSFDLPLDYLVDKTNNKFKIKIFVDLEKL